MRCHRRTRLCTVTGVLLLVAAPATAHAEPGWDLEEAYARRAEGQFELAARALERARASGASEQLVELEFGYLAAARGEAADARVHYAAAARGSDADLARRASRELEAMAPPARTSPPTAPPAASSGSSSAPAARLAPLDEGYRAKARGQLGAAAIAFERAKLAGADPQLVAAELGYLAVASGDADEASARFDEAARGPDPDLGERARRERAVLPKHVYADAYADAFAWNRVSTPSNGSSIVPTLRTRALVRPALSVPIDLYLSAQVTRDTASHGFIGSALPQIYADNYATLGGGLRVKLWKRVELFGQVGPAFNLLDDGRSRTSLDARGGALGYAETSECAPAPVRGAKAGVWPCLEAYAEGVYVSRFQNNVIGFARPRVAAGYLLTGPVLWQAAAEVRAAKDANNDYWNNFADAGVGHRWRLLAPFRLDLLVTANAGTYFGLAGRDPAPSRLSYVDARGLAATYVEF